MRTDSKFRLAFFVAAATIYTAGFHLMPEAITTAREQLAFGVFVAAYFALLPLLSWLWVVKAGQQKPWKILVVLATSCAFARWTFPADVADYFTFISWLRYPVIAVLLAIELWLMVHIVSMLWKVRHQQGDPRIHALRALDKQGANDKQRDLALLMAYEPTSWYYAVPRLTRRHVPAQVQLNTWSARPWFFGALVVATVLLATVSYVLLVDWSQLAALIASSFIGYCLVTLTANYRISRRYSVYVQEDTLVINHGLLNFMHIPLSALCSVDVGEWVAPSDDEHLLVGRGKCANVRLRFSPPQTYYAMMGTFQRPFDEVLLVVDAPQQLQQALSPTLDSAA